jgi:hypothetical protein
MLSSEQVFSKFIAFYSFGYACKDENGEKEYCIDMKVKKTVLYCAK